MPEKAPVDMTDEVCGARDARAPEVKPRATTNRGDGAVIPGTPWPTLAAGGRRRGTSCLCCLEGTKDPGRIESAAADGMTWGVAMRWESASGIGPAARVGIGVADTLTSGASKSASLISEVGRGIRDNPREVAPGRLLLLDRPWRVRTACRGNF